MLSLSLRAYMLPVSSFSICCWKFEFSPRESSQIFIHQHQIVPLFQLTSPNKKLKSGCSVLQEGRQIKDEMTSLQTRGSVLDSPMVDTTVATK